jgi:hypothetical protein
MNLPMKNSRDWSWLPCSAESTKGDEGREDDALREDFIIRSDEE